MANKVALTGNDAVGTAMMHINPDVVAAFPITPQTELMHKFAEFVHDGVIDTELILVESEHSAMSACIGASAAGARTMTATSSNGFALMWEVVYIAASMRLPIVMPLVNRALSGPLNIHCDHSDSMGGRDTGWIQLFSENSQEAYDNTVQAVRIAEHPEILTPVMPTLDGFIISHTMEVVELLEPEVVRNFIGDYKPKHSLLDTDNPTTYGALDLQDYYFEHRHHQVIAMEKATKVILEVAAEYEKLTGRKYELFEEYQMEDAEYAMVALGSTAGTCKVMVDQLRAAGVKAGLIKGRVFRPFPYLELAEALKNVKAVGVFDRSNSYGGFGGPLFTEIRSAMYGKSTAPIVNYIYGLGGRNISMDELQYCFDNTAEISQGATVDKPVNYIGVRGVDLKPLASV